jgi:hypothetical protein
MSPPMPAKVAKDAPVSIDAQKFTHNFHRHHFTDAQNGLRSPLAQPFVFQKVVHKTEYADQELGEIQWRDLRR